MKEAETTKLLRELGLTLIQWQQNSDGDVIAVKVLHFVQDAPKLLTFNEDEWRWLGPLLQEVKGPK